MSFKIGQQVVCVRSHSRGHVIKGKIYPVLGTFICSCGMQSIDVGHYVQDCGKNRVVCYNCRIPMSYSTMWYNNKLFSPLEYESANNEVIEKYKSTEEVPDTPIKEPVL